MNFITDSPYAPDQLWADNTKIVNALYDIRAAILAGGGGGAATTCTFVTTGIEASLPNSRQLVNGVNTTVNLGTAGQVKIDVSGAGTGDVVGPASAVDSRFAAFDGVTGKLIKDSGTSSASFESAGAVAAHAAATTGVHGVGGSTVASLADVTNAIATHSAAADPHTGYFKLGGRAGGQTADGGTGAGESLTLRGTAHATPGPIYLNDLGGKVGIGLGTTPVSLLHLVDTSTDAFRGIILGYNTNDGNAGQVNLLKARGGTAAVQSGDSIGRIGFGGYDGSAYIINSFIRGNVNGAVSAGIVPTDMVFFTGPTTTTVERLRIVSSGAIIVAATSYVGFGVAPPLWPIDVTTMRGATGIKIGSNSGQNLYLEANLPGVAFNCYYDSGRKFGDGSSAAYAGELVFSPISGNMIARVSAATGNDGAACTLTDALVLTKDAWLGINTAPAAPLHSLATGTVEPSLTYNSAAGAIFNKGAAELAMGQSGASPYYWWLQARGNANDARPIAINPLGGYVGIGTAGPLAPLDTRREHGHVAGQFGSGLPVYLQSLPPAIGFNCYDYGAGPKMGLGSSSNAAARIFFDSAYSYFVIQQTANFDDEGQPAVLVDNLRIDSNGYVGIGLGNSIPAEFPFDLKNLAGSGYSAVRLGDVFPLYVNDHAPGVFFNCYANGGTFYYGKASVTNYAQGIYGDPVTGSINFAVGSASGQADFPVTLFVGMSLDKNGKFNVANLSPNMFVATDASKNFISVASAAGDVPMANCAPTGSISVPVKFSAVVSRLFAIASGQTLSIGLGGIFAVVG
jgi:hypothetical protein